MDALLMCGGAGTRLAADTEKPLVPVGGVPMVERVRRALATSDVEHTYAVTTPRAPATAASLDLPAIQTPGDGYVADLDSALADSRVSRPVLTVAADLPLLDAGVVDTVLTEAQDGSLTVAVPVGRKRALGLSVGTVLWHGARRLTPAGINVVATPDSREVLVTRDRRLAANVNRPADRRIAEWYCHTQ